MFAVPIDEEATKADKEGNENTITISYKIKPTDSARFMVSSLSNFIDNLTEIILKTKCKLGLFS